VPKVAAVPLDLLQGVDRQKEILMENTLRFARGFSANNAMLWGARGTGKSSLVKAAHTAANGEVPGSLALIEIHREDIKTLPDLLRFLRAGSRRCLVFCDDLSFEREDADYKALKSVLDGGIEGRPTNVLFYATSNRRHLMSRDMIENERSAAIHGSEAIEEKVSLSDRFGLWIGFHNASQDTFFAMIEAYAKHFGLNVPVEDLHAQAVEWSVTRGSRSGRVAWQFIQDLAGRLGVKMEG
jgi:predicted AAA+ superfamily ATPase